MNLIIHRRDAEVTENAQRKPKLRYGPDMKQSKESQNKMVVGFAWYRPEQWQRVRDISTDADSLEDSYEA